MISKKEIILEICIGQFASLIKKIFIIELSLLEMTLIKAYENI